MDDVPSGGERTYPLPARDTDTDTRFTFRLVLDVAAVLERHGYPPPVTGPDWVGLQQTLFRYLYTEDDQ